MKIENIPIEDLIPYENNAKVHDETQIKNIAKSLQLYDFVQPVVVDKNNIIVIGHGRVLGAREAGISTIPCVRVDNLTEKQVKALRILDNKLNESPWDALKLQIDLPDLELGDFDVDFSDILLEDFTDSSEIEEDEPPEVNEDAEPIAKIGDVYRLGKHTLMCGDSTRPEDVKTLMGSGTADLVITDPPYNVDYEGKTKEHLTIQNDKMQGSQFLEFLTKAFQNLESSLKAGGAFYVWFASREHINFETALNNSGLEVRQELIWNKNSLIMGRQDYQWKHEPCLYGWKDGAAHYFIDDRTQTTVYEDKGFEFKKMNKSELIELLENIFSDKISTTIINEKRPTRSDLHPTMKPINLIARLIRNSSRLHETVLDLFGGSGTTLMACEQTNRVCKMMEFDPRYCDVIIQRWEAFTGQKAVLIHHEKG